jgi:hypothetical protein
MSPNPHVTSVSEKTHTPAPWVICTDTTVVPAGTGSVRLTFSASSSPTTPTVIVYVIFAPAGTDAGALFVTKASPR